MSAVQNAETVRAGRHILPPPGLPNGLDLRLTAVNLLARHTLRAANDLTQRILHGEPVAKGGYSNLPGPAPGLNHTPKPAAAT